ncbi:hypothetical protein RHS04_06920 [Rhizoctonia solani]|uniref:Uncharacterized protein n=1 Tax=Rhizoctonia solani TaxID=456999 RepID=A0A8H7LKY4_9AGAM|nr:hypothetical protein RHS04_06920 [Rhizoctonia solani]
MAITRICDYWDRIVTSRSAPSARSAFPSERARARTPKSIRRGLGPLAWVVLRTLRGVVPTYRIYIRTRTAQRDKKTRMIFPHVGVVRETKKSQNGRSKSPPPQGYFPDSVTEIDGRSRSGQHSSPWSEYRIYLLTLMLDIPPSRDDKKGQHAHTYIYTARA